MQTPFVVSLRNSWRLQDVFLEIGGLGRSNSKELCKDASESGSSSFLLLFVFSPCTFVVHEGDQTRPVSARRDRIIPDRIPQTALAAARNEPRRQIEFSTLPLF